MPGLLEWIRLNWLLLAFIFGLALIFVVLRTRPTEGIDSAQTLDGLLTTGQPVVLEFYSNL
jgi:hypothetical protein